MRTSKNNASEHQIQSAFIKRVELHYKTYPQLEILFAVPNAAKRSYALAAMLKAEGMKSGVPDIMWPYNNGQYAGLALEFKSQIGKLTDNQIAFMEKLTAHGWLCLKVNDAELAWQHVKSYLINK